MTSTVLVQDSDHCVDVKLDGIGDVDGGGRVGVVASHFAREVSRQIADALEAGDESALVLRGHESTVVEPARANQSDR